MSKIWVWREIFMMILEFSEATEAVSSNGIWEKCIFER